MSNISMDVYFVFEKIISSHCLEGLISFKGVNVVESILLGSKSKNTFKQNKSKL